MGSNEPGPPFLELGRAMPKQSETLTSRVLNAGTTGPLRRIHQFGREHVPEERCQIEERSKKTT